MRVHILQHVPFEGLGSISSWLQSQNATVSATRFFESPSLPELRDFDVLVALGGPMSVNDENELPWLREEKRLVRESIQSEKPVLGICLGAQLMASSLGSRVCPGASKEIGWFPVFACGQRPGTFHFPERTEVFHWHGETFDLPAGAVHLARSEACLHQAFQVGSRAIGLQFHLETTPESAEAILTHCRHELVPATYVQSEGQLRSVQPGKYAGINKLMEGVLTYLTRHEA
ncbi:MAG: gamma-glutamyl-gamma-aminobutyrate hydrolase family protein [Verrucomicrobiae bacterium]|nr:gamma-glutamyl-gamma-aminobutyrate hydrolase family protein [Verrucomicrobiae bacterium]